MPATPAWPPKSTPRLFVPAPIPIDGSVHLTGNAAHYLTHVMRRAVGDPVKLCDDVGGEFLAELAAIGKRDCILSVRALLRAREAVDDFWLCASPVKRQRWDWLIEKATELGVDKICPITMERSIAERINLERARAIATFAQAVTLRPASLTAADVAPLRALGFVNPPALVASLCPAARAG